VKRRKIILIVVVCVVFGLIGWQVIKKIIESSQGSGLDRTAAPVAVEVEPIRKDTIRDSGNFTGTLSPKSQYVVAPKISGRLERLLVDIGDRINRNQLIAVLDDEEYSQQVRQAEADLLVAQANLEESRSSLDMAQRELERVEELHKKGISADSELDAAKGTYATQEARFKVAQAQVANRQAALEAAKVRLSYTKIMASWEEGGNSRFVGERFVHEGTMLTANAPILSILEIDPLLAIIHITDKDYFRLKTGQIALIGTDALPDQKATGEIVRIAPLLKETSREARVEIEFANPQGLFKPGMFINVQIEFTTHEGVTVVPVSSVVKRDSQQGVFLADMENKVAQFVPVKVGISTPELAEIIEPTAFSGYVVTLGQHLLADGSPIILPSSFTSQDSAGSEKAKSGEKR
jgi:RND family efflux transporter MFP subunit